MIIYWQVRIFTSPPCFLKRGQENSLGTFQKYYLFHSFIFIFILSPSPLLLEAAGNTNPPVKSL